MNDTQKVIATLLAVGGVGVMALTVLVGAWDFARWAWRKGKERRRIRQMDRYMFGAYWCAKCSRLVPEGEPFCIKCGTFSPR